MREPLAALGRLALGGLVLAGCAAEEPGPPPGGTVEVQWVGSDTGRLVAPAEAEWCDSLRLLEVRAMHGDTGIALVLYPSDSVTVGDYPMVPPDRRDTTRPAAALALRWFAETSIRGFRGDSGSVTVSTLGPGTGAGRFGGTLRSATEGSRLTLRGSFRGLAIRPAAPDCAGVAPDPDDSDPDLAEEFRETAD